MMRALALWLLLAVPRDESLEAVRASLEKTGVSSYAYAVKGRFDRTGEFIPPDALTSRIGVYQSARRGPAILVKGPEGLWKTAAERLGEKVEKPEPDAADRVRTLQEAEAPHRMAQEILSLVGKGRPPEDREVDGVMCRRFQFAFVAKTLKAYLQHQIDRAVLAGTLQKPDEIQWSTAKGSLRIYASKKDDRILKVIDERSVKIAYSVPDGRPQVKTYRLEMEFVFSEWGRAKPSIPAEVKDRLGLKDE